MQRTSRIFSVLTAGPLVLSACASESDDSMTTTQGEAAVTGTTVASPTPRSLSPEPSYGAATVDGDPSEWSLSADFFADMFEAGKPDKPILSKLYLRYACDTETLYALVLAEPDWLVVNSDDDNFVKLGNSSKLVDGSFGNDGAPPDFEYIPFEEGFSLGWEASVPLAPGEYDELNVHAQLVPRANRSATSAVSDRAIPIAIVCEGATITTSVAGTTTSSTVESTTSTSVAATTTTTMAGTTTSTAAASTTTSTMAGSTTSTTAADSTTTTLDVGRTTIATSTTTTEATTTSTVDVGGSTLPNTGPGEPFGPMSQAAWMGMLLVLLGGLVVRVVRDRA